MGKTKTLHRCGYLNCGYTSNRRQNVKRHENALHKPLDKLQTCCGIFFLSLYDYFEHRKASHVVAVGVASYTCATCGIHTRSKSAHEKHQRVHTKIHPFKCSHCGYTSPQRSNVVRHLQKHQKHEGVTATCINLFAPENFSVRVEVEIEEQQPEEEEEQKQRTQDIQDFIDSYFQDEEIREIIEEPLVKQEFYPNNNNNSLDETLTASSPETEVSSTTTATSSSSSSSDINNNNNDLQSFIYESECGGGLEYEPHWFESASPFQSWSSNSSSTNVKENENEDDYDFQKWIMNFESENEVIKEEAINNNDDDKLLTYTSL